MKKTLALILTMLMVLSAAGFSLPADPSGGIVEELGLTAEPKEASAATAAVNSAVYDLLDFEDTREAEFAVRGLIEAPEALEITAEDGRVVWSQKAYAFLEDYAQSPDTANPSLWENTKNNHAYGLFEVVDGIYQVRGYDMANLTLIEGDTGWIVFDPLMSVECTQAAMALAEKHLGQRPISAVIISHPHVDHFGGIKGVMTQEQAADASLSLEEQLASGQIPVIVPEDFEEHAVSENVYAGRAMSRRAKYQYGVNLEPSVQGALAMGIGMGQSEGTVSYISPTFEITATGETYTIDGVTMEFQMTPGTEAPAEMNVWFPEQKALWVAENCTSTLHNLYTLRGAQVRDGARWSGYICEAITRYGDEAAVTFQSHNWPHWGNDVVNEYLLNTAAVYRYINDQTLTYINQGYTTDEISNMIQLPEALAKNWYTRQYYGTVAHNSKAVYQKFMGWYDANPVNLDPLSPEDAGKKWVEYMALGSVEEVLRQAKADFDAGEYQWVAQVTNTIVFADPENWAARLLCADALEQLGYQAESGTWRNAYLTGAMELRDPAAASLSAVAGMAGDMQRNMSASAIFDYMGILLDKQAMADKDIRINVTLTDTGETFLLRFVGGVLLQFAGDSDPEADVSVTTVKNALFYLLSGNVDAFSQVAAIEGDIDALALFVSELDQFDTSVASDFNIVEP